VNVSAVNQFSVSAETLYSLPSRLWSFQDVFQRTGGLHASRLFNSSGHPLLPLAGTCVSSVKSGASRYRRLVFLP
jgi:formate dehydrogenase assembly factor FdhD